MGAVRGPPNLWPAPVRLCLKKHNQVHYLIAKGTLDDMLYRTLEKKTVSWKLNLHVALLLFHAVCT